jgi:hypothetical protein
VAPWVRRKTGWEPRCQLPFPYSGAVDLPVYFTRTSAGGYRTAMASESPQSGQRRDSRPLVPISVVRGCGDRHLRCEMRQDPGEGLVAVGLCQKAHALTKPRPL